MARSLLFFLFKWVLHTSDQRARELSLNYKRCWITNLSDHPCITTSWKFLSALKLSSVSWLNSSFKWKIMDPGMFARIWRSVVPVRSDTYHTTDVYWYPSSCLSYKDIHRYRPYQRHSPIFIISKTLTDTHDATRNLSIGAYPQWKDT